MNLKDKSNSHILKLPKHTPHAKGQNVLASIE